MSTLEYFYDTGIIPEFIDEIYNELYSIPEGDWYTTWSDQCRFEASSSIFKKMKEIISIPISDCGFFKNKPGWIYPEHIDSKRSCAFNILLSEPNIEYVVKSFAPDFNKVEPNLIRESYDIPYVRNRIMLLNTKQRHSVHNNSLDKTRYIMTMSVPNISYNIVRDILIKNN